MWKLAHISNENVQEIAMSWLEKGLGGEAVACLASYAPTSMRETHDEFLAAFLELNVETDFDDKTLIFKVIQHYLRLISEDKLDPWIGCRKVVSMELKFYPMIKLFHRPDCEEHFAEKAKTHKFAGEEFAGQYFGIEKLVELYYRPEQYDDWTDSQDLQASDEIRNESTRLINTLFSDGNLPLASNI